MFAPQLLRILQSIPTDVNYETCAFDTPKPKLIMTDNQIGDLRNSNSSERKADPLFFSVSEPFHANGNGGSPRSLAFGSQDGHDFWSTALPKSTVLDTSKSNEPEGSPVVGDEDGSNHLNGFKKDTGSFLFDTKDQQETLDSMIEGNLTYSVEKECKDSVASSNVQQAFESNWNPFADKDVVECEVPEFAVCYKEINMQMVKDICVDEGIPTEDKILTENDKDDHSGSSVVQHSDDDGDCGTIKFGPDIELFIPDAYKSSSPEDMNYNSDFQFETEKIDEKIADDGTDQRSSISSDRLSEEFMLQDALLGSSKCGENKVAQQLDEVPSIEAILESLAVAFTSEELKKDGPVGNAPYNSKVEGGSITFDFNSSKSEATSNVAEHIPRKAHEADSEKVNVPAVPVPVQLASSEEKLKENTSASNSDSNFLKQDAAANNETGNLDIVSVSSRFPRGEGETSFSASAPVSGLITYSGPIAYSGSISLRSDSSTTSTRSFAFPVLQSEWSSSPVRMQKADPKHLRKHRGWRHGLCCCRF